MKQKRKPRIKVEDNLFKVGDSYVYRRGDFEQSFGRLPNKSKAIEAKEILEAQRGRLGGQAFKWKVKHVFPEYMLERKNEMLGKIAGRRIISPRTYQEIQSIWEKHLRSFFANKRLSDIDSVLWSEYCRKSKLADLSNHRKVLRTFLAWCEQQGKIKYIPTLKIPHVVRRKRKTLSQDEIKLILSHSKGSLLIFVSLYLFMGVRRTEQIKAKWENVDFNNMAFVITDDTTRTRTGRVIPLNRFVASLLAHHKNDQIERGIITPWVFPKAGKPNEHATQDMPNTAWKTMLENAGLSDSGIEPHDLRATYEHYASKRLEYTDTQREKMAGASMQTQRRIYLRGYQADDLRGLEESVKFDGLDQALEAKLLNSRPRVKDGDGQK